MPVRPRPLLAILAACVISISAIGLPAAAVVAFDIPPGTAEKSLKVFSRQSGCGVICVTEDVTGVHTNPVQGKFTPADAIKRMLDGTVLTATQDEQTHAFAVRVKPPPGKDASRGPAPEM